MESLRSLISCPPSSYAIRCAQIAIGLACTLALLILLAQTVDVRGKEARSTSRLARVLARRTKDACTGLEETTPHAEGGGGGDGDAASVRENPETSLHKLPEPATEQPDGGENARAYPVPNARANARRRRNV